MPSVRMAAESTSSAQAKLSPALANNTIRLCFIHISSNRTYVWLRVALPKMGVFQPRHQALPQLKHGASSTKARRFLVQRQFPAACSADTLPVMLTFSADGPEAERQMRAVIFYMTTFGYIDGDFDDAEKAYVRDYIRKLVAHRVRGAVADDAHLATELTQKYATHFLEVFETIDHQVKDRCSE